MPCPDTKTNAARQSVDRNQQGWVLLICLALGLGTVGLYLPAWQFDFINYDDPDYVWENDHVQAGLTWNGFVWAFTTFHAGNWHPLTWLSHMADCQLFGLQSGAHHRTNVLLHAVSGVVLFLALRMMTGALWPCAVVAALFAWHPQRVESVAWIAERKDVLCAMFWMLTLLTYVFYARRPSLALYCLTLTMVILGAMAKPMIITLPFVLLLLDYWPLRRLCMSQMSQSPNTLDAFIKTEKLAAIPISHTVRNFARLCLEKAPLFLIVAGLSTVTMITQHKSGFVVSVGHDGLIDRLASVVTSYGSYLLKSTWPVNLALPYPLQTDLRGLFGTGGCNGSHILLGAA